MSKIQSQSEFKHTKYGIPMVLKRAKQKVQKTDRLGRFREKDDIVNCFSLVDKLTKRKR